MPLSKADLYDADVYDAPELNTDGSVVYLTITVVSTVAPNIVNVNLASDGEGILTSRDHPVEAGNDFADVTGTTGGAGDGTFLVASVVSDTQFTVTGTVGNSTGGSVNFRYRPGAKNIGYDFTGRTHITHNNVQDALTDLDGAVTGGIDSNTHKTLRQLIHLADGEGGPFEGFTTGAYRTETGTIFPTSVIWYEDNTLVKKIVEKTLTYTGAFPTTIQWKVYNTDGSTVLAIATDTITYTGAFETSRTRAITDFSVGSSFLTEATHKTLRQLIHLADGAGGPFEGFTSGAYRETTPTANPFPTGIIWYDDVTKTKKIVEKTITYNPGRSINTLQWKVYDTDGVTVLSTVTDTIAYSGIFETSRTRAIV